MPKRKNNVVYKLGELSHVEILTVKKGKAVKIKVKANKGDTDVLANIDGTVIYVSPVNMKGVVK